MNSIFLLNLNKSNLYNEVSEYIEKLDNNISNGNIKKQLSYKQWFLIECLDLLSEYDFYNPSLNLLSDEEFQNISNTIQKIINKEYYEYNK